MLTTKLALAFAVLWYSLLTVKGRPALSSVSKLEIQRGFVEEAAAKDLYYKILDSSLPGPKDNFHPNLIGFKGDAGSQVEPLSLAKSATDLRHLLDGTIEERKSGIFRVEHLKRDYNHTKNLINNVVENRVLEEGGTIHMYLSNPDSAALDNHTDPTDIAVLQLSGVKEWLLCEEIAFARNSGSQKQDRCATYKTVEMDRLICRRELLFPGDVLFLPKRVVHSARATQDALSAHLTFGFADTECRGETSSASRQVEDWRDRGPGRTTETFFLSDMRKLQTTCTAAEGGTSCDAECTSSCPPCDFGSSCDEGCDADCNTDCDICGSCNSAEGGSSCDGSCDICDTSCDTSCDICNT